MAGGAAVYHGTGGSPCTDRMSNEQRCHSADSLAEWRSCEQVENGTPSTSPAYWDIDDGNDGAKPADLYGRFTWKIENFSQTTKKELKSNVFEVGGYKWYILIYPQGCEVSNHLSLFLCVFDHEKILPGWSHFAQFTIAVVNKDPKKSKYSDTLHRFCKKEHDWGWKKFMELSKVSEGFINADTLVIKAQVQVIREKTHRPFRCLDRHYRRELVRVYLSNVEQICRRLVEERKDKLGKFIVDTVRWASFRGFWLRIDQVAKQRMSRENTDTILKLAVKHFFIEKEVTSTLVMDSLYSGLKALEDLSKNKSGKPKVGDMEELPAPMVLVEEDMFVLADDILLLLQRVAVEHLPQQRSPSKDEKGLQNRTKDGSSGEELLKDSIERDERHLTELGRRTVELFVLSHIFSRIEVAYQEDVALMRQEELIREEEAEQVDEVLNIKRAATEKEKRSKKKQAKQKRNARKGKDRGKDEKSDVMIRGKNLLGSAARLLEDFSSRHAQPLLEKIERVEDDSYMSDVGDDVQESLQPELDDRDTLSINWDTDTSEYHPAVEARSSEKQNGNMEKTSPSIIDDSCSTCSTDSVPSVVINGPYKGNSSSYKISQTLPVRVQDQRSRDISDQTGFTQGGNKPSYSTTVECEDPNSSRGCRHEPGASIFSKGGAQLFESHPVKKEEVPLTGQTKLIVKDQVDVESQYKSRTAEPSFTPVSLAKKAKSGSQRLKQLTDNTATVSAAGVAPSKVIGPIRPVKTEKSAPISKNSAQDSVTSKSASQKLTTPSKNTTTRQVPQLSRPLTAPLIPCPRSPAPIVSSVQATPQLSRSLSAVGRLGTDASSSTPSYFPKSYRNAIVGKSTIGISAADTRPLTSSTSSQSTASSQPPPVTVPSASLLPRPLSAKDSPRHGLIFGSVAADAMHSQPSWRENHHNSHQEASGSGGPCKSDLESHINRITLDGTSKAKKDPTEVSFSEPSTQAQAQGTISDEFPHLAIINELLADDLDIENVKDSYCHSFNRQYIFPRDTVTVDVASLGRPCQFNQTEQYYREGFQRAYGTYIDPIYMQGGAHSAQVDHVVYANGQIDGTIPSQWPYQQDGTPMLNFAGLDANGFSYQLQEYLNSTCVDNGYGMYRSTNGY